MIEIEDAEILDYILADIDTRKIIPLIFDCLGLFTKHRTQAERGAAWFRDNKYSSYQNSVKPYFYVFFVGWVAARRHVKDWRAKSVNLLFLQKILFFLASIRLPSPLSSLRIQYNPLRQAKTHYPRYHSQRWDSKAVCDSSDNNEEYLYTAYKILNRRNIEIYV